MGTRSWIIAATGDHEATQIICHRDSHPWELGQRLQNHYGTDAKARALVRHGDAITIQETAKTSVFFHRDWKRPMQKSKYPSVQDAIRDFNPARDFDIEYVYVRWPGHRGQWAFMTVTRDEGLSEPAPITPETIAADRRRRHDGQNAGNPTFNDRLDAFTANPANPGQNPPLQPPERRKIPGT